MRNLIPSFLRSKSSPPSALAPTPKSVKLGLPYRVQNWDGKSKREFKAIMQEILSAVRRLDGAGPMQRVLSPSAPKDNVVTALKALEVKLTLQNEPSTEALLTVYVILARLADTVREQDKWVRNASHVVLRG